MAEAKTSTDLRIGQLMQSVEGLAERVATIVARQDSVTKADDARKDETDPNGQILALLTRLVERFDRMDAKAEEPEELSADSTKSELEEGAPHFEGNREEPSGIDQHHGRADAIARQREQEDRLAELQQRWSLCANWWGKDTARPMIGASPASYDRSQARRFQQFSKTHARTDLSKCPDHMLHFVTDVICAEAAEAARDNNNVAPGRLRMITRHDQAGRAIHEFVGGLGWMDQFKMPSSRLDFRALQNKVDRVESDTRLADALRSWR